MLPLVEFYLAEDISDEEALRLLDQEYIKPKRGKEQWTVSSVLYSFFLLI